MPLDERESGREHERRRLDESEVQASSICTSHHPRLPACLLFRPRLCAEDPTSVTHLHTVSGARWSLDAQLGKRLFVAMAGCFLPLSPGEDSPSLYEVLQCSIVVSPVTGSPATRQPNLPLPGHFLVTQPAIRHQGVASPRL